MHNYHEFNSHFFKKNEDSNNLVIINVSYKIIKNCTSHYYLQKNGDREASKKKIMILCIGSAKRTWNGSQATKYVTGYHICKMKRTHCHLEA